MVVVPELVCFIKDFGGSVARAGVEHSFRRLFLFAAGLGLAPTGAEATRGVTLVAGCSGGRLGCSDLLTLLLLLVELLLLEMELLLIRDDSVGNGHAGRELDA